MKASFGRGPTYNMPCLHSHWLSVPRRVQALTQFTRERAKGKKLVFCVLPIWFQVHPCSVDMLSNHVERAQFSICLHTS